MAQNLHTHTHTHTHIPSVVTYVLVTPAEHSAAAAQAVRLARRGITQMVFSDAAMLALFRERRAALEAGR